MKVFNLTTGRKAELLADVGSWRGTGDGLVNGALTKNFHGYEFHNSFQAKVYGEKEETNFTPADFTAKFGAGVEAVCFCIGHNLTLDVWEWCYCASHAWLAAHGVTPRVAVKVCNRCHAVPAMDSYATCEGCHEESLAEAESACGVQ